MPDRSLYLKFVDTDVTAQISLYWDVAPITCETLWGALDTP